MQDAIENSLDKLDAKYSSLNKIIKTPLFYDSPEVRSVITEINEVQDVVLEVAFELSGSIEENKNEEDKPE